MSADARGRGAPPTELDHDRRRRSQAARDAAPSRPALRFAVASGAAVVGLWLVYAAFVLTELGQRAENLALEAASLRSAADRAESLGQLSQISLVSLVLALLFIVLAASARKRAVLGLTVAAAMGVAIVASEVLKGVLPRPELVDGPSWILRNSFPSGTATIAAGVGLAILLISPDRLRWLALPVAGLLAAIIGQATQVAGWHRMSDAVGAVLLSVAVAAAALAVLAGAGYVQRSDRGRISRRVRAAVALAGLATLALGGVVLVIAVLFPILTAPEGASGAFLHTTFDVLGTGITLLVFVAVALLIEPYSLGVRAAADGAAAEASATAPNSRS